MTQIVDAKTLATRLFVKPATIHAWRRRGWIPALRAGRRPVLYDLDEVMRVMKSRALQDSQDTFDEAGQ